MHHAWCVVFIAGCCDALHHAVSAVNEHLTVKVSSRAAVIPLPAVPLKVVSRGKPRHRVTCDVDVSRLGQSVRCKVEPVMMLQQHVLFSSHFWQFFLHILRQVPFAIWTVIRLFIEAAVSFWQF